MDEDLGKCLSKGSLARAAGFKLALTCTYFLLREDVTSQIITVQNCNTSSTLDELNRFCETYHSKQYKIYIISEVAKAEPDPKIETILMAKDSPLTLDGLIRLSSNLGRWLHANTENVAVITSPLELERAAFIAAVYLLHHRIVDSTADALTRLTTLLKSASSVSVPPASSGPLSATRLAFSPSQMRYLECYETAVQARFNLPVPRVEISSIRIDHPDPQFAVEFKIEVRDGGRDGSVIFSGSDAVKVRQQFALIEFPTKQMLSNTDIWGEVSLTWIPPAPLLANASKKPNTGSGGSLISSNKPTAVSPPPPPQPKPPQKVHFWFNLHQLSTDVRSRYFGKPELDGAHLDVNDSIFHEGFGVEFFYSFAADVQATKKYQLLALRQSRRIFRPTAKLAKEFAEKARKSAPPSSTQPSIETSAKSSSSSSREKRSTSPASGASSSSTSSNASPSSSQIVNTSISASTSTSSTPSQHHHHHHHHKTKKDKESKASSSAPSESRRRLQRDETIRFLFDRAQAFDHLRSSAPATGVAHHSIVSPRAISASQPIRIPQPIVALSSTPTGTPPVTLQVSPRSRSSKTSPRSAQQPSAGVSRETKDDGSAAKHVKKQHRGHRDSCDSGASLLSSSSGSIAATMAAEDSALRTEKRDKKEKREKSDKKRTESVDSVPPTPPIPKSGNSPVSSSTPLSAAVQSQSTDAKDLQVSASLSSDGALHRKPKARQNRLSSNPTPPPPPASSTNSSTPSAPSAPLSPLPSPGNPSPANTSSVVPSPSVKTDDSSAGSSKSGTELGPGGGVELVSPSQRLLELRTVFHEGAMKENAWQLDPAEVRKVKLISNGATAFVYKGYYRNQRVAIKEFSVQFEAFREAFEEVKKEFTVISTIKSPYVMYFFGALLKPNLAMVVEYCSKGSLFDVMNDGTEKITWRRVIRAAQDIALGIGCLHNWKPPVVHRDLKSLNLLVDKHWTVKVGDFGSSRFTYRNNGQLLTTLGRMRGTFTYTPPELFEGELFTTKGDIYAYGIVLWELATRCVIGRYEYPYADTKYFTNQFQILMQAAQKGLRPTMRSGIPEPFQKLIRHCWAQKPSDRPDDAEIGKALKAIEKDYLKGEVVWDSPAKSARGENLNKHLSQFDHLPKLSAGKDLLTSSAPAEDTRFADVLFVQEEADDDDSSSSTSSSVSSDSSDSSATASLPVEPKVDSALPPPSDWKN